MNNRHKNRKADPSGNRPAKLRILDKEVQIACKPGEEDDLLQAAAYIDKSMRELRNRNTTSSIEKIAIVTAINTANALLKSRSLESSLAREQAGATDEADITERLSVLNSKIDELLETETETAVEAEASSDGGDADTQEDVANQTKEAE